MFERKWISKEKAKEYWPDKVGDICADFQKMCGDDGCDYCGLPVHTLFHKLHKSGYTIAIVCCKKCSLRRKGIFKRLGYETAEFDQEKIPQKEES